MNNLIGLDIYKLASKIFPINRSITGNGVRDTFELIREEIPELNIYEIPSGEQIFDWTVPHEWNISSAWIKDCNGNKVVDFSDNNLHLVSYSEPIDKKISFNELSRHLHSLPDQPNAIPYVTSYYKKNWGFCLTQEERDKLKEGEYSVHIDSSFNKSGSLTYGELLIPGKSSKEIMLSTYICHPSMGNNEVSGPSVTTFVAKYFLNKEKLPYSVRIVFVPETVGSIAYIHKNLKKLKKNIIAGYVLTCIGDDGDYSFLSTKRNNTISDKAAHLAFLSLNIDYKLYSYMDRGSDERQYNSPGVDLNIASIMRTKYGEYPEYHTSLDDLDFISASGLGGGYNVVIKAINIIMTNVVPVVNSFCEPKLDKYGLYPSVSTKKTGEIVKDMMNLIAYADGNNDLISISQIINVDYFKLLDICNDLVEKNIVRIDKVVL